jgi:hypothetical protein
MMKGIDNKIFFAILIISFIIGFYIFNKDYKDYANIITFLSIMVGFKITSLSILFNSPLKKKLYDSRNPDYQTELHRLRDFYKHSLYFDVLSIAILFIVVCEYKYIFIFPIISGSIYCFYRLTNELLKIFVYPTNEEDEK